jgi:hypothetical protein
MYRYEPDEPSRYDLRRIAPSLIASVIEGYPKLSILNTTAFTPSSEHRRDMVYYDAFRKAADATYYSHKER